VKKIIPKELFEQGLAFAASNNDRSVITRAFLDVDEWLEATGFDRDYDTEFFGKYFPDDMFEHIDDYAIQEYFETTLDDPEARLLEYRAGKGLSTDELENYKEKFISNAYESGDYPGIYCGDISDGNRSIYYFGTRTGYSWEGISYEDYGIFLSEQDAIKILFNDGVLT
jgi:hypothetical protein